MPRSIRSPLALAPVILLLASVSAAQSQRQGLDAAEDFDRSPQDCVQVSRIQRTEVLDDQTVLFHLRGRTAYRNHLPRRCPGLERNDRFMYSVTSGRLCAIDTITVLEQFAGRVDRGFTCPLGQFHPVTPEDIEELRSLREHGESNAIESEPAELPEDEADEEAL